MQFQVIFQDNSHPMFKGYLPYPDINLAATLCEQHPNGREISPGDVVEMGGGRYHYSGEVNGARVWVELTQETTTPSQINEIKKAAESLDTSTLPVLECNSEADKPEIEVVTPLTTTPVITKTVPGKLTPPSPFESDAQKVVKTPLRGYAPKLEKENKSECKVERAKPPSTNRSNKNSPTPTPSSPPRELSTVDSIVKRCQELAASKVA